MNSIDPKKQEDIIFAKLISNRNKRCLEVIPTELQSEFVQEIVPDNVLRAFAQALRDKHVFGTSFPEDFMRDYVQNRININRFGIRLLLRGVNPEVVISRLLEGV